MTAASAATGTWNVGTVAIVVTGEIAAIALVVLARRAGATWAVVAAVLGWGIPVAAGIPAG